MAGVSSRERDVCVTWPNIIYDHAAVHLVVGLRLCWGWRRSCTSKSKCLCPALVHASNVTAVENRVGAQLLWSGSTSQHSVLSVCTLYIRCVCVYLSSFNMNFSAESWLRTSSDRYLDLTLETWNNDNISGIIITFFLEKLLNQAYWHRKVYLAAVWIV